MRLAKPLVASALILSMAAPLFAETFQHPEDLIGPGAAMASPSALLVEEGVLAPIAIQTVDAEDDDDFAEALHALFGSPFEDDEDQAEVVQAAPAKPSKTKTYYQYAWDASKGAWSVAQPFAVRAGIDMVEYFGTSMLLGLIAPQLGVAAKGAAMICANEMTPTVLSATARLLHIDGVFGSVVGNIAQGEAIRHATVVTKAVEVGAFTLWSAHNSKAAPQKDGAESEAEDVQAQAAAQQAESDNESTEKSSYTARLAKSGAKVIAMSLFSRFFSDYIIGTVTPTIANYVGRSAANAAVDTLPSWTYYIGLHHIASKTAQLTASGNVYRAAPWAAKKLDNYAIPIALTAGKAVKATANGAKYVAENTVVPAAKKAKPYVVAAATKVKNALIEAKEAVVAKAKNATKKAAKAIRKGTSRFKRFVKRAWSRTKNYFDPKAPRAGRV